MFGRCGYGPIGMELRQRRRLCNLGRGFRGQFCMNAFNANVEDRKEVLKKYKELLQEKLNWIDKMLNE
ncbi:hypothetical protein SAMN05660865_00652 [Caloramator fervidus]|uniref:Uncharacterized protein n=1 Tax=Caloramator fervidus TaxID=29344 RepID=A0A1H5TMG0_9CLOT|nr:DUF5320 family protein [Caloramator fervidus]SEF63398.1 hypothetical protein SAMN05660865_00652 [Caloramator fervidus]